MKMNINNLKYGRYDKVMPISKDDYDDLTDLPSPEILSRIKMGDIKTSDETELYMNVVTKIKKSLEKRKLDVFDWSVGFDDKEQNKPSHFLIEFMFNGRIVLLDGKVIDRYISEVA